MTKYPATIKFFAIYEKGKPFRVLPSLLFKKHLEGERLGKLELETVLVGNVKIPKEPAPWSEISENADLNFLALQSRDDWGEEITSETNLLKNPRIKEVVLKMEESLNAYSFRKDHIRGKFNYGKLADRYVSKAKSEPESEKEISPKDSGVVPGSNWQ